MALTDGLPITSTVDKIVAQQSQQATKSQYDPNAPKVAEQASQIAGDQASAWKSAYAAYHPEPLGLGNLQPPPEPSFTPSVPPYFIAQPQMPSQPMPYHAVEQAAGQYAQSLIGVNPLQMYGRAQQVANAGARYDATMTPQASPLPEATQQFPRPDRSGYGVGNLVDLARTHIPYSDQVAEQAGKLGGALGETMPQTAIANQIAENTPLGNLGGKDTTPSNLVASGLEGLVPREAWQAALMLLPAAKARSLPEFLSAITLGDIDALAAAKKVTGLADDVIKSDAGRFLQSERGSVPLGPAGDEAGRLGLGPAAEAGDASLPAAADNLPPPPHGSLAQRIDQQPATVDEALLHATEWLRKGEKARPEQAVMFAEQRKQQLAKMGAEYATDNPDAHLEALKVASGGYERPSLSPLQLTPEHEQAIRSEINTSAVWDHPGQQAQAHRAFTAMQQGHLPTPGDAIEFAKIAGSPWIAELGARAPKNWANEFIGLLGVPQTLQSTMDASAILRQMAPLGWTNPKEYFDAIGTIGRAVRSDKEALALQAETLAMPWVGEAPNAEAQALGLAFSDLKNGRMADIGGHLHESEGQFSSINQSMAQQALEKLPWVKPSERIYNVPINRLRGAVYSKWAQNLWESGVRDPKQYEAVAKVIDHASGWGTVVPGEIARGLNAFYAPRALAARFQVLLDPIMQPGSLLKPSARQLAARNLVGFVGANAAMLGLMGTSGVLASRALGIPNPVSLQFDPRSTDSFKAKIGNMRIDMTGGYGSIIRLVARLAPIAKLERPQTKDINGVVRDASASDLVDQFFRGKMGPIPGAFYDALGFPGGEAYGADWQSKEGLRTAAFNQLTPFFVQDVVEAWREQGPVGGALAAPISFLGGGINTYEQSETGKNKDLKTTAMGQEPGAFVASLTPEQKQQIYDDPSKASALATSINASIENAAYKKITDGYETGGAESWSKFHDKLTENYLKAHPGATPATAAKVIEKMQVVKAMSAARAQQIRSINTNANHKLLVDLGILPH